MSLVESIKLDKIINFYCVYTSRTTTAAATMIPKYSNWKSLHNDHHSIW